MSDSGTSPTMASIIGGPSMSKEERRQMRNKKRKGKGYQGRKSKVSRLALGNSQLQAQKPVDLSELLNRPEEELLKFSSTLNNVYRMLNKPAPFTTIVFAGMQSTGKSTLVERFLGIPLNVVQDGTGTRCPLHVTAIHDPNCRTPVCDLRGKELKDGDKSNLNCKEAFALINKHTEMLSDEQSFSVEPIYLTFRARNVENLRFVDTPGIISTASDGEQDNRQEIQHILRHLFKEPNTKLCLLLQTNEFDTNSIVDFCDETFGSREEWVNDDTTCIMTKFDKQVGDTATGTRANKFFEKFHENGLYPFLVYTPIIKKTGLQGQQLYQARVTQLATADAKEKQLFFGWHAEHESSRREDPTEETLNPEIEKRVGFAAAKLHLREVLLRDIYDRLPDVFGDLEELKVGVEEELAPCYEKKKLYDNEDLKKVVLDFMCVVVQKMIGYLDGDLQASIKFKDSLQTLADEIEDEEDSEWAKLSLNHFSNQEDSWRERIARFEGEYPESVQPEQNFLG